MADATSGSTLATNSPGVLVTALGATTPEGSDIDGWQITESAEAPTGDWLDEAPQSYTITGPAGIAALYAWVKDSADKTGAKAVSIYFNTAAPAVTNVVITAGEPGTATVTWTTDIPAEGSVKQQPQAGGELQTFPEGAVRTQHSVLMTGLPATGTSRITLVNTEVEFGPVFWPETWPIEGDATLDCRVNILDLIFIRNRLNQSPSSGDNWQADVTGDGRINILDLIYVRNRLNNSCP